MNQIAHQQRHQQRTKVQMVLLGNNKTPMSSWNGPPPTTTVTGTPIIFLIIFVFLFGLLRHELPANVNFGDLNKYGNKLFCNAFVNAFALQLFNKNFDYFGGLFNDAPPILLLLKIIEFF